MVDPNEADRWTVFHREVGDELLTLAVVEESVIDVGTGTTWDISNGRALAGPLEGEILGILPAFTSFESDARTFWPDARYWTG